MIIENAIVKALTPWGAFIMVNNMETLCHINEISHSRISAPSELLKIGQKLRVKITKIDTVTKKVSTSIKALTENLNVDLYTYVNNWDEFKDLQKSFLYASVSDAEIPTDVGIHGCLMRIADLYNIKFVINGHSFRNESIRITIK